MKQCVRATCAAAVDEKFFDLLFKDSNWNCGLSEGIDSKLLTQYLQEKNCTGM